ncbi:putative nucleotidyltransferase [Microbacterium sp. AK009]|uniref:nucleotidyltransferase domain-containing protein n=1 Tax=Microbacterium sp. AK009 TaxID=2723068 RepID=UPI0015CC9D45|nr:nucleotidyltransferase domain-containing protein [Microbacterium sp. AK009]NYF18195.1 putative nucleotidyltransferase [Microbacterium sp. AK009]
MQQIDVVKRFISDRFPGARVAVIAGSTARGNRTQTSDIDLLLIGDDMLAADTSSLAATFAFEGEIFEVFAYNSSGFEQWAHKGLSDYRPVIIHMLLEGIPVRGAIELAALKDRWRTIFDEGPVVPPHELDLRRYAITDLIDDLRDATDPLERYVVASALFERTAELMLLTEGHWIGAGKYLPRRLRALSEERADLLARPLIHGDLMVFADRAEDELRRAGGRVQAGLVR